MKSGALLMGDALGLMIVDCLLMIEKQQGHWCLAQFNGGRIRIDDCRLPIDDWSVMRDAGAL